MTSLIQVGKMYVHMLIYNCTDICKTFSDYLINKKKIKLKKQTTFQGLPVDVKLRIYPPAFPRSTKESESIEDK